MPHAFHSAPRPVDQAVNPLEQLRQKRGWSKIQLGQLLGVSGTTAGRYCRRLDDREYRMPQGEAARRLPAVTAGEVTLDMMIADPVRAVARAAAVAEATR